MLKDTSAPCSGGRISYCQSGEAICNPHHKEQPNLSRSSHHRRSQASLVGHMSVSSYSHSDWCGRPDQPQCPSLGHWSKWITFRHCRIAGLKLREGSLCIHDEYSRGDGPTIWTASPGPEGTIRYDSRLIRIYWYPQADTHTIAWRQEEVNRQNLL